MKLAADAFGKRNLTGAQRKQISERILELADLLVEVANAGELPFDATRAAQIHEKVEKITNLVNTLIEKAEAL